MKRIFAALMVSAMALNSAMADEVNYFNKSWAEIKAKAKAEHKYIFIDCYTDWCGWCKVMDKETMVDPAIAGALNNNFIAVKMDMEHGEGSKMSMKYHISAFPSFMFFTPEGEFVYEAVGYQKTDEFTKTLKNAMDKTKQFHATGFSASLDVDYPEFYKLAYAENGKRKFPDAATINGYLDKQKDMYSEITWGVLSRFNANEKHTKFFLDNIKKYEQLYGSVDVNNKVDNIIYDHLKAAIKAKDEKKLASTLAMVDKYSKEDAADKKASYRMNFYKETQNWPKYEGAINEYIAKNGFENAEYFNSICWNLFEKCDNKPMLKKSAEWMQKVVEKEPQYAYLDTYASLLYKTGNLKEAETWANKAIAAGKEKGDDVSATATLLEKIKSGK